MCLTLLGGGGGLGRVRQCLTFGQMMAPNPGVMSYYILQLCKGINKPYLTLRDL